MKRADGFTLIEVLVSLMVIGVAAGFLSPTFLMQANQNLTSEIKTQALDAAQRRIDTLRVQDPATLPSSGSDNQDIQIGGRTFRVNTAYCVNSTYCSVVTRHLTVTASYRGKQHYATETIFTQLR